MRVLLVEDFEPLRESVAQGLREAGYAVDEASDGEVGLWHAGAGEHDVIVLDLMLPKLDGWSVLSRLRERGCPSQILVLTARDTTEDKVRGLESGADDYLVKPFEFPELLARIKALVRRKYEVKTTVLCIGYLEVDTSKKAVRSDGKTVDLSAREYALLEYLALNAGRTVSRTSISEHLYDFNATLESNVVDVLVGRLRRKIERPGRERLIHTKRGQGYVLASLGDEA
jgi:DNA-binding response OmpR family regulator